MGVSDNGLCSSRECEYHREGCKASTSAIYTQRVGDGFASAWAILARFAQ
jgi:hypothetical protein